MKIPRLLGLSAAIVASLVLENTAGAQNATTGTLPAAAPAATSPTIATEHPKGIRFVVGPANGVALATADSQKYFKTKPGDVLEMKVLPMFTTKTSVGSGSAFDASGNFVAKPDQTFTYHVRTSGKVLGSILTGVNPQSGQWVVEAREQGGGSSTSTAVFAALDFLAALPQVKTGAYEARQVTFLRTRGTGQSSASNIYPLLWLKSDPGGTDLFYTLKPGLLGGNAGTLYTATDLAKAIKDDDLRVSRALVNAQQPQAQTNPKTETPPSP